jgi:hypothetical protein
MARTFLPGFEPGSAFHPDGERRLPLRRSQLRDRAISSKEKQQ